MLLREFNPIKILAKVSVGQAEKWQRLDLLLRRQTAQQLRARNAHWHEQPTGLDKAIAVLWVINEEFTRRGIAPGWRQAPQFVKALPPPPRAPHSDGTPGPLGETLRRKLLLRWIDLAWLRHELGPAHQTKKVAWRGVFLANDDQAWAAFARVNAVQSAGGGKVSTQTPWQTLAWLNVSKFDKLALEGLIDRDAGALRQSARNRVEAKYEPAVEGLKDRKFPLTQEQVAQRLIYCEALDLARGSPTDAARAVRWMTGETITRQSMHQMKLKLTEQCGFRTLAWRAQPKSQH
ncbi:MULTISPECIES: hypothetical protein [unclassified Variovorax]|uniref:hypothetical protein n=1 Tax=unclassified Variovorax TaxID=663243 RepID=UPI002B22FE6A|nr:MULTISPECIES: hypothetical protein [unclassified Variovorax]MEB0060338.1 hypothetical protein [Variovorax sp. LG9.2]MEB0114538.1 hypothetical protein [Variovorax sp. RTB1]